MSIISGNKHSSTLFLERPEKSVYIFSRKYLIAKNASLSTRVGVLAEKYLSFDTSYEQKGLKKKKIVKVDGYGWKTALKVASFILTGFLLPIIALIVRSVHRSKVNQQTESAEKQFNAAIVSLTTGCKKGDFTWSTEKTLTVFDHLSQDQKTKDNIETIADQLAHFLLLIPLHQMTIEEMDNFIQKAVLPFKAITARHAVDIEEKFGLFSKLTMDSMITIINCFKDLEDQNARDQFYRILKKIPQSQLTTENVEKIKKAYDNVLQSRYKRFIVRTIENAFVSISAERIEKMGVLCTELVRGGIYDRMESYYHNLVNLVLAVLSFELQTVDEIKNIAQQVANFNDRTKLEKTIRLFKTLPDEHRTPIVLTNVLRYYNKNDRLPFQETLENYLTEDEYDSFFAKFVPYFEAGISPSEDVMERVILLPEKLKNNVSIHILMSDVVSLFGLKYLPEEEQTLNSLEQLKAVHPIGKQLLYLSNQLQIQINLKDLLSCWTAMTRESCWTNMILEQNILTALIKAIPQEQRTVSTIVAIAEAFVDSSMDECEPIINIIKQIPPTNFAEVAVIIIQFFGEVESKNLQHQQMVMVRELLASLIIAKISHSSLEELLSFIQSIQELLDAVPYFSQEVDCISFLKLFPIEKISVRLLKKITSICLDSLPETTYFLWEILRRFPQQNLSLEILEKVFVRIESINDDSFQNDILKQFDNRNKTYESFEASVTDVQRRFENAFKDYIPQLLGNDLDPGIDQMYFLRNFNHFDRSCFLSLVQYLPNQFRSLNDIKELGRAYSLLPKIVKIVFDDHLKDFISPNRVIEFIQKLNLSIQKNQPHLCEARTNCFSLLNLVKAEGFPLRDAYDHLIPVYKRRQKLVTHEF